MSERQIIPNLIVAMSLALNSCAVQAKDPHTKALLKSPRPIVQTYIPEVQNSPMVIENTFETHKLDQPSLSVFRLNENKYLAETKEEATEVAIMVGVEDASNMCGPLAGSILLYSGRLPADYLVEVKPEDFWLFDPNRYPDRTRKLFPESLFDHIHFSQATERIDFKNYPLQVLDFVYLSAGKYGGIGHMLVVTRIDEPGRAYSITNVRQSDGTFKVQEVILYDPNIPFDPSASSEFNPDAHYLQGGRGIGSPEGRIGADMDVWRLKE